MPKLTEGSNANRIGNIQKIRKTFEGVDGVSIENLHYPMFLGTALIKHSEDHPMDSELWTPL